MGNFIDFALFACISFTLKWSEATSSVLGLLQVIRSCSYTWLFRASGGHNYSHTGVKVCTQAETCENSAQFVPKFEWKLNLNVGLWQHLCWQKVAALHLISPHHLFLFLCPSVHVLLLFSHLCLFSSFPLLSVTKWCKSKTESFWCSHIQ